jgi:hypothetical protein
LHFNHRDRHRGNSNDANANNPPEIRTQAAKARREEIRVENFKNGLYFIFSGLESLNGMVVPQQLSTEDADEAIEQIRCGERALRALANRIKQVRSGPKLGVAHGAEAPDVGAAIDSEVAP